MTNSDICEMLKAYNEGLMTSEFEHYEFVSKLAFCFKEIKKYYEDIESLRYEIGADGFYVDNHKIICRLNRRIDILNESINDMVVNFINEHQ